MLPLTTISFFRVATRRRMHYTSLDAADYANRDQTAPTEPRKDLVCVAPMAGDPWPSAL